MPQLLAIEERARRDAVADCQALLRRTAEQIQRDGARRVPHGLRDIIEQRARHFLQAAELLDVLRRGLR